MRKIKIIYFILLAFGCDKPEEVILSDYPNGMVHEKIVLDKPLRNGDTTGLVKAYFSDGSLKAQGRFEQSKKQGLWILFHHDGSTKWQGNFERGKLNGEVFWSDEYGSWGRTNYVDGVKEGKSMQFVTWYSESEDTTYFYKFGEYRNNKPNGLWQKTDTNKTVLAENTFVDGKITGYFTNRYPNGKIKLKGQLNINPKGDNKFNYFDEHGIKRKLKGYEIEFVEP